MENQIEKMGTEMETGVIKGFKELGLSHCIGESVLITIDTHNGNLISVP